MGSPGIKDVDMADGDPDVAESDADAFRKHVGGEGSKPDSMRKSKPEPVEYGTVIRGREEQEDEEEEEEEGVSLVHASAGTWQERRDDGPARADWSAGEEEGAARSSVKQLHRRWVAYIARCIQALAANEVMAAEEAPDRLPDEPCGLRVGGERQGGEESAHREGEKDPLGKRQRRAAAGNELADAATVAAAAAPRTAHGTVWLNGRLLGRCAKVEQLAGEMRRKRRKTVMAFREVRGARPLLVVPRIALLWCLVSVIAMVR